MPELPEVETVCRGLQKPMAGQTIAVIETRRKNLRIPFPVDLSPATRGRKIAGIRRRAKYVLIDLDNKKTLILHLGMSGRITAHPAGKIPKPQKHDHMIIRLENGSAVFFNDARRFGLVDIVATKELSQHRFFKTMGPEPFDKKLTPTAFRNTLKGRKTAVKIAIMDQRLIVGVGNIYASEALFMSKINPSRPAGSLSATESSALLRAIRRVLEKAIKAGGSSLKDYVQADGELGYFQHSFAVYGRDGTPCPKCKTAIAKKTQGGRSTFYCPACQK